MTATRQSPFVAAVCMYIDDVLVVREMNSALLAVANRREVDTERWGRPSYYSHPIRSAFISVIPGTCKAAGLKGRDVTRR